MREYGTNIMIVDDNKTFLDGISLLINNKSGYNILSRHTDGQSAIDDENLDDTHLILLDIEMPGINGFETAKKIREKNSNLKIIAITMYKDRVYLDALLKAGFSGFVYKVIVAETLFQTIKEVLDGNEHFPTELVTGRAS